MKNCIRYAMKSSIICMAFCLLLTMVGPFTIANASDTAPTKVAAPLDGASLYNIDSKWIDLNGKALPIQESLQGKKVVLAMVYMGCSNICPMIVERMRAVETALPKNDSDNVQFALFSFDSKNDTTEHLAEYARAHALNLKHWKLFHGDERAVLELAAALGFRYRKEDGGSFEHSNLVFLLDEQGIVLQQQPGSQLDVQSALKYLTHP